MTSSAETWQERNQRALMAALAKVRVALQAHARIEIKQADAPSSAVSESRSEQSEGFALDKICGVFGLSPFERDILLLSAGIELDSTFANLCAAAQGDPRRTYPTFSLALAVFPEAHWSALVPAAPLRHWKLIELAASDSLTTAPLRIDERILHYLTGVSSLDERLRGTIAAAPPGNLLPPSHQLIAEKIARLWSRSAEGSEPSAIQLNGDDEPAKAAIAAAACTAIGSQLFILKATDIPAASPEREILARLWEREAILAGSALLIDCAEAEDADHIRFVRSLIESLHGRLLISGREPLRSSRRLVAHFEVAKPTAAEQQDLWRDLLSSNASGQTTHMDALVAQFNFGTAQIHAARNALRDRNGASANGEISAALWDVCRTEVRQRLDGLAERIEPLATWDDLVLPAMAKQILREIATHVRQRATVYDQWGFRGKSARGLGISALFSGASGTGKTMAAEVLAGELRLDLYRIDLSSVVSKYIGETEKNLRRLFEAAEQSGAILFFDEADALFGKRSEVKDSHDRYANIEVSYLLQRMEAYRGLAILTTNMKQALDPAFLRRIRFVVEFPFPDAKQRAEIWRRIFPKETPTENLDPEKLARLNVAGGNIRNVALQAAFLAADAGEPVRMHHLTRAARGEYAKLEKLLTEAEVGGWQ